MFFIVSVIRVFVTLERTVGINSFWSSCIEAIMLGVNASLR